MQLAARVSSDSAPQPCHAIVDLSYFLLHRVLRARLLVDELQPHERRACLAVCDRTVDCYGLNNSLANSYVDGKTIVNTSANGTEFSDLPFVMIRNNRTHVRDDSYQGGDSNVRILVD